MARVKITLRCTNCGQSFEHIHYCQNSREAASYEEWAKENITICPNCRAAAKNEKEQAKVREYLVGIEDAYPLPQITGVSEKQIAFAEKLRSRFIEKSLVAYSVNIPKFFQLSSEIQFSKLSADDLAEAEARASEAGKPVESWFAEYRASTLEWYANLPSKSCIHKIEVVFKESISN